MQRRRDVGALLHLVSLSVLTWGPACSRSDVSLGNLGYDAAGGSASGGTAGLGGAGGSAATGGAGGAPIGGTAPVGGVAGVSGSAGDGGIGCGNGRIDSGEACDDGGTENGDGCSALCQIEPGFQCFREPSTCIQLCGDGVTGADEACDDGNRAAGDGCGSTCDLEPGYVCDTELSPSVCVASCGNGSIDVGFGGAPGAVEECDDGDLDDGDGCNANCVIEPEFQCVGQPSLCSRVQIASAGPGLAIALEDDAYDGAVDSMSCVELSIPDEGLSRVIDVQVGVGFTTNWIGDFVLKLISPENTVLTIFHRPGLDQPSDDGQGCCGTPANASSDYPLTFRNTAPTSAEHMGNTLGPNDVVCLDDGICHFSPAPGAGPGTSFADFTGETPSGTWRVCLGDAASGFPATFDSARVMVRALH